MKAQNKIDSEFIIRWMVAHEDEFGEPSYINAKKFATNHSFMDEVVDIHNGTWVQNRKIEIILFLVAMPLTTLIAVMVCEGFLGEWPTPKKVIVCAMCITFMIASAKLCIQFVIFALKARDYRRQVIQPIIEHLASCGITRVDDYSAAQAEKITEFQKMVDEIVIIQRKLGPIAAEFNPRVIQLRAKLKQEFRKVTKICFPHSMSYSVLNWN